MSVQGGMEEMKSGRVVVSPEAEPMSDVWFYQDGFIKNKVKLGLNCMCSFLPNQTWIRFSCKSSDHVDQF